MVQIIPPSPRAMQAEKIGEALGLGASKYGALQEARGLLDGGAQSPADLALGIAKLSMAAPGLERSLGEVYKQMLAATQSGQKGQLLGGVPQKQSTQPAGYKETKGVIFGDNDIQDEISPDGAIPPSMDATSNTPENRIVASADPVVLPTKGKMSSDQIDFIAQKYVRDIRPDLIPGSPRYGNIPTFNYETKSDLDPEQEAQLRQDLRAEGAYPQTIEEIVKRTRENVNRLYNESLKNFGLDIERQKQIKETWEKFVKNSEKSLVPQIIRFKDDKPRTFSDLSNKYFEIASELPINLTPEQMHTRALAELRQYETMIDGLAGIPPVPPVRNPQELDSYLTKAKNAYKPLVEAGFVESVKEDAVKKDMGIEEVHYALWGDQTSKKSLDSIASVNPYNPRTLTFAGAPFNYKTFKDQKRYRNQLSSKLKNIQPKDDLVLLKGQVLANGGTEDDFVYALNEAKKNGLELSPFQKSQEVEINIPRKMPISQIFNSNLLGNWYNYIRGKR